MNTYTKTLVIATTILLTGAIAVPANAAPPTEPKPAVVDLPTATQPVAVPVTAIVNFEAPKVASVAAPIPEPVDQVTVQSVPAPQATLYASSTKTAPVASYAATAPATTATAPATPAPAVPSSGIGAALLASAYGQIGTIQDCTAMVEKALRSVGKRVGDLAPAQFFQFGTVVATPQPGDILISSGHVGIYAGNGQMVSGGFNGNQTVVHPVSYVGAFTAVRVA